jgi:phenylalanyl-tRNA synthetase alpha subunit
MDKWYALINSGIFRQETLEPLGLGGKTVLAWGMGASRVATLLAGKASMRDITGATCDFDWLKNRPIMTRKIVKRTGGNE